LKTIGNNRATLNYKYCESISLQRAYLFAYCSYISEQNPNTRRSSYVDSWWPRSWKVSGLCKV